VEKAHLSLPLSLSVSVCCGLGTLLLEGQQQSWPSLEGDERAMLRGGWRFAPLILMAARGVFRRRLRGEETREQGWIEGRVGGQVREPREPFFLPSCRKGAWQVGIRLPGRYGPTLGYPARACWPFLPFLRPCARFSAWGDFWLGVS
jgi:hypothetical protein